MSELLKPVREWQTLCSEAVIDANEKQAVSSDVNGRRRMEPKPSAKYRRGMTREGYGAVRIDW